MPFTQIAYRLRGFLVSLPLMIGLFSFVYETEVDWLIWPLGGSVFFLGLVLRIWSQQHLHYRLKVKKYLITAGPYSFIRNPIYIGNMLMCLGAIVTSELLWLGPITLFYCFSIYSLVVRYEEDHLLEKYGESYQRYLLEVPRWLPRTIRFRNVDLINRYFLTSVVAEIHCPLLLLPYVLKEFISPWFGH